MKLTDIKAPLTPSILDRLLGTDVTQASPLFSVFDLLNVSGLVVLLRKAEEPVSVFLKEQFSTELSSQIDTYNIADDVPGIIKEGLVAIFNRIVDGDCVYEAERFEGVKLSEEVIRLYEHKPKGRGLMNLNRMLLEDAYPRHLRTRRVRETPYSLQELKRSVSRDIEALLNTRRELLEELPPEFQEVSNSVLTYGLPDFTSLSLNSHKDRKSIQREIETTLGLFEPRLRAIKVMVEGPKKLEHALHFRIDAMLLVEPNPEAVSFDAMLQLSTSTYSVNSP
jgi:type VI secretion system protein ImpF